MIPNGKFSIELKFKNVFNVQTQKKNFTSPNWSRLFQDQSPQSKITAVVPENYQLMCVVYGNKLKYFFVLNIFMIIKCATLIWKTELINLIQRFEFSDFERT